MTGDGEPVEVQPAEWPPPMASRAVRRHCVHAIKSGYCVYCGASA